MKKVISSLTLVAVMTFGFAGLTIAAEVEDTTVDTEVVDTNNEESIAEEAQAGATEAGAEEVEEAEAADLQFVQTLKQKFIEGDPFWMSWVLICLIIGLALSIERIVYLNLSTINTKKFLDQVETALKSGGVEAAKDICRNTRGPIASIFYQGLDLQMKGSKWLRNQ